MNVESVIGQLNGKMVGMGNTLEALASSDVINNPAQMLQVQFAVQQYSTMVGYESAVMKAVKDMMSGIIAKI